MNQLNPGDKVQLTAKAHAWHTEHIVDVFKCGDEFQRKDYEEIAMILLSKARRVKLKGLVVGYGAEESNSKQKKYLLVEFFYKDMSTEFYCSESDLKGL